MAKPLPEQWLEAKYAEAKAQDLRRSIEDQLVALLAVNPDIEGTTNHDVDGFKVKVTTRLNSKVDADLVQEIAAEHGLEDHLPTLFRWKPEISLTKWRATSNNVTGVLARAITTKAARPSFAIEEK
jgi:hypothetical protein